MVHRDYHLETVDEFLSRGGQITRIPSSVSADRYEWETLAARIDNAPLPVEKESDASRWHVGDDIAYAIRESQMGDMPNDIFEE